MLDLPASSGGDASAAPVAPCIVRLTAQPSIVSGAMRVSPWNCEKLSRRGCTTQLVSGVLVGSEGNTRQVAGEVCDPADGVCLQIA